MPRIQGPPGAGKTFTGARMICELVRRGKKVGITANSHKVIRNLIDATIKAADELRIALQCCQRADEVEDPRHRLFFAKRNEDLLMALSSGAASVGGGTAWLWSRPDAFEAVDFLFVDEAAQVSLANVVAVSQAAASTLGVPGMDPGLEVQVLCGASWKQPQAEGNCTQVGASRDNPAWRREVVWGRSRRRAAAPNVSEALRRPGRSGERAKERDAQNPTEIGAVLGPGAAVHPVSLPWEVCMGPRRAPHRA